MRRRLVAASALVLALGAWGRASAAEVIINPYPDSSGSNTFGLYVQNSLGVPIGSVNVVVENGTGFELNTTIPGVSPADSVYRVRPLEGVPWDVLIVNNTAIGVTLIPAGATVRLGTLSATSAGPAILPGETIYPPTGESVFGLSFLDAFGNPITGYVSKYAPYCEYPYPCTTYGFSITVPEPERSLAVVLALTTLAWAAARRALMQRWLVAGSALVLALVAWGRASAASTVAIFPRFHGSPGPTTSTS